MGNLLSEPVRDKDSGVVSNEHVDVAYTSMQGTFVSAPLVLAGVSRETPHRFLTLFPLMVRLEDFPRSMFS